MFNEQFTYLARTILYTQLLIRTLNFSKDLESLEDSVSMPCLSVHGMLRLHLYWFLRFWGTLANLKARSVNFAAIQILTSNISVISIYRHRWFKVVELSVLISFSKDDSKSLYSTCKTLSCSLLIWVFSFRLLNIYTTGQYEKWQITKEFSSAQNSLLMQV